MRCLEGWRQFVAEAPPPPRLLSEEKFAALSAVEQELDDEAHLDHHARLLVVAAYTVRHTVASGRRLVLLNRHAISTQHPAPSTQHRSIE
ncbi:hypothetical protein ACGF0D_41965 [Kitasatospora sp. NPDC048298]|uniref:hypothetical protein n=1 Tax=Kitasatospora sp. NPDC048298 TaxID=3364049 RepID=UPI0037243BD5